MTISYPVTLWGHDCIADAELRVIAQIFAGDPNTADRVRNRDRVVAALNYTQDLSDEQLTEDSAGTVIEDRDRLLAALRELQANPNDPRAHRTALDAMGGC